MDNCKRCGSTDLKKEDNYIHEDILTNEEIVSKGYSCNTCSCFHDENGSYEYEIGSIISTGDNISNWATDYDVKKKKKEIT